MTRITTVFVAVALALGLMSTTPADARGVSFRDCVNSWKHQQSHVAAACRSRHWVVTPRLVVGVRGIVRHNTLPTCSTPVSKLPCFGRAVTHTYYNDDDWNQQYVWRSFYIDGDGVRHYVWRFDPTRSGEWNWIDQEGLVPRNLERHGIRCVMTWQRAKIYESLCPQDGYRPVRALGEVFQD